ncbi:hypothetical protein [Nocardia sp. AG03]|uniref:hypothetical protein n=1 Tax=Nocardia sp. AG03 TaxID=3025312 RepID=UPI002418A8F9|nr:hypothetical protein [Nocardia sp. AG03]
MNIRPIAVSASSLLSGAILGYSVHRTVGAGWTTTASEQLFGTPAVTTAVIAALVGMVAVWLLTWGRLGCVAAFGTGLAGLVVVGSLHALPAPQEWNELPLALGIGLGLLIVPAVICPAAQRWFFGGAIAAGVLGFQLDTRFDAGRYPYGDFPSSTVVAQQPWQFIVAGLTLVTLLAAMWSSRTDRINDELPSTSVAFGATLAIAAGLVVRFWPDSEWLSAAVTGLILGTFAAARRFLPPDRANSLAAAVAATGILILLPGFDRTPSILTLAVGGAALIGGALCGVRIHRPALAVGLCAGAGLIATLSFISETNWVRLTAGALLLFAVAASTSCLPMEPALLAGWSVLPTVTTLAATALPAATDPASIPRHTDWLESEYIPWSGVARGQAELMLTDPPQQLVLTRPEMILPGLIATGLCAWCAVGLTRRTNTPINKPEADPT